MATEAQRKHLCELMDYTVKHEPQFHYRQFRPMDTTYWSEAHMKAIVSAGLGIWMDCSEGVTALCKWAGLSDPNGNHYNGYGNTDSLYAHLPHYHDARHALPGALVIWGSYPGTHHVTMVRKADPVHGNPLVWSMGWEGEPRIMPLSVQRFDQSNRPFTFLNISHL